MNPTEEQKVALALVRQHIEGHKQLLQQESQAIAQGATQAQAAQGIGEAAATTGEAAQQTLGAEGGGGL